MHQIFQAILISFGMFWQVLWSLILGFLLSSIVTVLIPKQKIVNALGQEGPKQIALATLFGSLSSSCSYAAASMSKSLFKKGAGFIPSLAFLFSSTNLVIELGLILFILMGWQFTLAEWLGGLVLIFIMSILIKLSYPKKLISEARTLQEEHSHHHSSSSQTALTAIAQNFFMEISMLKKDLVLGFLIAGLIAVFVPDYVWNVVFLQNTSPLTQVIVGSVVGPVVAILSFVCSIGNVPLAAVLWSQGLPFSGVLSFLYADLIVIPLLDVYRRYYGLKMASYIGVVFFITMVLAGIIMYSLFSFIHQIPPQPTTIDVTFVSFRVNYTLFLNLTFLAIAGYLYLKQRSAK